MAALTELRNLVHSGNVSIKGSRHHQDFDDYLVTKEKWEQTKALNLFYIAKIISLNDKFAVTKDFTKY